VDGRSERLSAAQAAKFTAATALAAIFIDASIGHGLTWENDPYWTYWITKTFLIATVFGLGTAWFGVGPGRGAVITAVHTLVLTVYYWTFSPIGLPSTPTWLDLEHTWITGLPIHFGVIYAGYLLALWAWRRRRALADAPALDSGAVGVRAVLFGIGIVVVTGGIASVALGEFPGVTWFLVRLLITVTFLLVWWGLFGIEARSAVVGGVLLALMWATYSQFLGPVGLPDTPLRILNPAPPPAVVRWLDYRELWLISFPIYLLVMVAAMLIGSRAAGGAAGLRRPLAAAAVIPLGLLTMGLTVSPADRGISASFSANGTSTVEGAGSGTGSIRIDATDMGNRVSPLPPNDRLTINASLDTGGHAYELAVRRPMVEDPTGQEPTWWGVGFDVDYREQSGEDVRADLVAFGLGDLRVDGTQVGRGLPVEAIASRDAGYGLTLEVGSGVTPIPGGTPSELHVRWPTYIGSAPEGPSIARYIGGSAVLLLLLGAGLYVNSREGRVVRTEKDPSKR
jgi:hypothetical protein